MKKKLIAILLTLCMVLGMLPMSALADWYHGNNKLTLDGVVTIDNQEYYALKDTDNNKYYAAVSSISGSHNDNDTIDYYEYYNGSFRKAEGSLTWKASDPEPDTVTITFTGEGVTFSPVVLVKGAAIGDKLPTPTRDGYTFAGWFNGEVEVTAATKFTEDTILTAKWTPKDVDPQDYYVTLTPAKNGTVTLVGVTTDGYAPEKSEVTVTATADEGYELDKITVKDAKGAEVTVTGGKFIMPSQNVTVTVTFKAIKYTVTIGKAENGTVKADKATAAKGDTVTVTATPADGYELDKITVKDAKDAEVTVTGNKFTMPAGNVTVTATFKPLPPSTFAITAVASPAEGGTVTTTPTKAKAGENVKINVIPNKGWKTVQVMAGDVDVSETYSFTMPEANVTVTAFFERIPVIVPTTPEKDEATGNVSAEVDMSAIEEAAQDENAAAIVIPVQGDDAEKAPEVSVKLPEGIDEAAGDKAVTIETPAASVTLDSEALKAVKDGATITVAKDADVTAKNEDGTDITDENGDPIKVDTVKVDVKDATGTVEAVQVSKEAPAGAKTMWVVPMIDGKPGEAIQVPVSNGKVTWQGKPGTAYAVVTDEVAKALGVTGGEKPPVTETFTITVTQAPNGKVTAKIGSETVVSGSKYPKDSSVEIAAEADANYKIDKILVNGTELKAVDGKYVFTLTEDTEITASFSKQSSGGSGGGGGGGGGSAISHSVTVGNTKNGSVRVNSSDAVKGEKVTITVRPSDGYVLDALTVKDANGKEVTLTKVDDTTYTFIMPETKVTVDATFKAAGAADEDEGFTDVAKDSTFYGDIAWAADKGYMTGYSDGTFRPDAGTTRQVLWMVLARMDGADPADMAAARTWAMEKKISDGTNPTNPVTRQQMVAMLYRYAQLKGYKLDGGKSLDTFSDAASVADYAKDAMSWAVGNGIVQGTASGTLNPTGAAIRAHFAAFLHRFCQTAGIA